MMNKEQLQQQAKEKLSTKAAETVDEIKSSFKFETKGKTDDQRTRD